MGTRKVGAVIRRLRELREMSQRDLAKRTGVTQAYVAQLETGAKVNPSLDVLKRLAKALGVPVTELLS